MNETTARLFAQLLANEAARLAPPAGLDTAFLQDLFMRTPALSDPDGRLTHALAALASDARQREVLDWLLLETAKFALSCVAVAADEGRYRAPDGRVLTVRLVKAEDAFGGYSSNDYFLEELDHILNSQDSAGGEDVQSGP